MFGFGSERTPAVGHADGDVRGRKSRVVLTPGVLASSHVVMLAAQPGTHISHLHGDGGNSATLPEESTKDTVKTIAQGRPGDRHHLSSTPCAFSRTRGTSGASRRPAFPAPLLSKRAEADSNARAKQAARMSSHVHRHKSVSCPGRSAASLRRCAAHDHTAGANCECEPEAPPSDAIKSCRRATANARDFARRALTIQRLLPFCGLPHWMRFCRK
ncbi:hypothetical protein C7U92_12880 [Bradyrhizobium sp. WBOS7]|uniref:Uncharacterized protein n=1 Tax=Bradyrhizobium betae TaxID=244734 RepID=A0AAE9N875_9BRAD|nr:hypothetical protein [Bradyrhizobium sp. WBOS2]MDD1570983.1 hypothetical protein [Bradyrhizobium sp. WBOS1]MDD1577623.1 hypothetical protein [Bradyrhizobium sp. WBOS7]MDD1600568.1 hypothetical protein [Bradyrhizobium sp. WBOS16]UUO35238.1 hypothetical protein DCK84_12115 [Bradyrhizobium sp. WBOS01]UUO41548.1 hypothetical protein DCM75_12870 [Bradyrhizobium sp. WBOS02]UUO55885.1 hypothetical protein DCM79_24660 [Bradyrhizobium sp. WBOS07]UUO65876.1 hypothetical protein DCM83_12120 [Bradyrh